MIVSHLYHPHEGSAVVMLKNEIILSEPTVPHLLMMRTRLRSVVTHILDEISPEA